MSIKGHRFEAKIFKVGINLCVKVPQRITDKMSPTRGYIPIKGKIQMHFFEQTLVPVKNAGYRLYVNGLMLKGANCKLGQIVKFRIEQNFTPRSYPMPAALKRKLIENDLLSFFRKLAASRQKEILRYLSHLKTIEAKTRNEEKVIGHLKKMVGSLPL